MSKPDKTKVGGAVMEKGKKLLQDAL